MRPPCAVTPPIVPSRWPYASRAGLECWACRCGRAYSGVCLAFLAAASIECHCLRPYLTPLAVPRGLGVLLWPRVLWLAFGCDGFGIYRVPMHSFVSHPAGHVPRVLGVFMWPCACSGSCSAVVTMAYFACRRIHSYLAGHVPCVLDVLMSPRVLGSRSAVMAAASIAGRCLHSSPIPLAVCLA